MMATCPTRVLPQAAEPIYDLTVITVCRNVLPELKRTTASVLGYKAVYPTLRIEHLVVDGASTDGTAAWLEEQLQIGKIDAYISEPDCGIYDAMNKGINMARGRVLFFLNADDVLTQRDLAPCVEPILRGEVSAVAAHATQTGTPVMIPNLDATFLYTPCCHQAYFAATDLYRRLGGYDAASFRCCADGDFMARAFIADGQPLIQKTEVADMAPGGLSSGGRTRFADDYVLLMYRHQEHIFARAEHEPYYAEMLTAHFLNQCMMLRQWQADYNRDIPEAVRQLAELCARLAGIAPTRRMRAAMHFAATTYLPELLQSRCVSQYHWWCIRRFRNTHRFSPNNPFTHICAHPHLTLFTTLRAYRNKLLHRRRATV